jgi:hypothetical protein
MMLLRFSRLSGLLLILVATLAGGCIFSPLQKPPKAKVPFFYPKPISPPIALQNMINAYNNRDSVETGVIYDENYQGYSPDAPSAGYFTRADEVHHVHRLYNDPNIVNVDLSLGPVESWQSIPPESNDLPGTVVIAIRTSTITINVVSVSLYEAKNIPMEYAFTPKVSALGDTTWTIIRWRETPN